MTRYAIVADLNRCVGCQTCTSACKHQNATAPGVQWRKVLDFETGEFPDVRRAFMPVGCMHCEDPPCLDVCPSTATRKRDDGIVTIDYDICIGCAYCAVACPYQARFRVDDPAHAYGGKTMAHEALREDPRRIGVAQKCTFCVDRIDDGLAAGLVPGVDPKATPACVNSCIADALHFGDVEDPDSNVSVMLRENRHFKMHEELGTGPGIMYLYAGNTAEASSDAPVPLAADPVGLAQVSPQMQENWDWRAAGNFILGGTGTGLFTATMVAGLFAPMVWPALFLALALVGAGLSCVWLEIGRPFRFLNVFRHPQRSWMSREAIAAMPFLGLGGLGWLLHSTVLGSLALLCGWFFVYAQGRILKASKGIPAWRQPEIVSLIVATGLTEGTGLFAALAIGVGQGGAMPVGLGAVLLAAVLLRYFLWRRYRAALGRDGAPVGALAALDGARLAALRRAGLALVLLLLAASAFVPVALILAGLLAMLAGWSFKYVLITKAAFNQGYALNRMPARGAGTSAAGIKPGWAAK